MRQKLHSSWKNVPSKIRRPVVFIVGGFFIVLAGTVGWLPGPGGIPIFLLGIAILSTEFMWADRLKQAILLRVKASGNWIRNNRALTAMLVVTVLLLSFAITYKLIYTK